MYRPTSAEEKWPVPDAGIVRLVNHLHHLKASKEDIHEIKNLLNKMAALYAEALLLKMGDCAGKLIATAVLLYFPLSPMAAGLLSATGYWLIDALVVKGSECVENLIKQGLLGSLCDGIVNEISHLQPLPKQSRKRYLFSIKAPREIKNLIAHLKIRNQLMRDVLSVGDAIHLRAMLGTFVGASAGAAWASQWIAKSATHLLCSFAAGRLSWHFFRKPSTVTSGGLRYVVSQADKDATIKPFL
jgi:hypothetical protein